VNSSIYLNSINLRKLLKKYKIISKGKYEIIKDDQKGVKLCLFWFDLLRIFSLKTQLQIKITSYEIFICVFWKVL